jgi:cytidylate kinase
VRIVRPLAERTQSLMQRKSLSEVAALREIEAVDQERAKFIRKLFHRSVDDPLAYDLIVNEAGRSVDTVVDLVAAVAKEKIGRLRAAGAGKVPAMRAAG